MRLENDPSIGLVHCQHCQSPRGTPCKANAWEKNIWVGGGRGYVRSHMNRLVRAQAVLGKMCVDARFSRKKQLAAADGFDKLRLEILKRRSKQWLRR